jgi:hypothetical protein
MMPASNKAGGTCLAFPDVCKTPAPPAPFVPIPYPNTAQLSMANPSTCTRKVKIGAMPVVTTKTEVPMSSGDEAGSIGGMVSSMIKGAVKFKKGSSKVKFEGTPGCYIGSMTGQNGSNANMPAGAQIAPSQTKVLICP